MASQGDNGIPLSHAPDGRGYRLLELPPELVSLLEADDSVVLTLSSSERSAVLKTPGKTYSLRQKNTSNALILLLPITTASPEAPIPEPGLGAIATLHETIELMAEDLNTAPAAAVRGKWHEKFGRDR